LIGQQDPWAVPQIRIHRHDDHPIFGLTLVLVQRAQH
jgi:hypothetical protein